MSECKHQCIILKRICIFILGVVIGFAGGYKYHQTKVQHRVHDRLLKQAEKPLFKRYGKQSEPFENFLTKRKMKLRERLEGKENTKGESPTMRYLLIMLLAGCASVKSVKQPFVDIGIDGQPQIIETLDSASDQSQYKYDRCW